MVIGDGLGAGGFPIEVEKLLEDWLLLTFEAHDSSADVVVSTVIILVLFYLKSEGEG